MMGTSEVGWRARSLWACDPESDFCERTMYCILWVCHASVPGAAASGRCCIRPWGEEVWKKVSNAREDKDKDPRQNEPSCLQSILPSLIPLVGSRSFRVQQQFVQRG